MAVAAKRMDMYGWTGGCRGVRGATMAGAVVFGLQLLPASYILPSGWRGEDGEEEE